MRLIPSIPTIDQIVANAEHAPTIVINGQPYIARSKQFQKSRYYANIVKRIIAAGYVLFGKGMVIQYAEDLYKKSDIQTLEYK